MWPSWQQLLSQEEFSHVRCFQAGQGGGIPYMDWWIPAYMCQYAMYQDLHCTLGPGVHVTVHTSNTIHPSDFKNFWNVYYTFHYNIAFLKFIFLALCSGLIIQISSRSHDRLMWDISKMYRYLLFMFWRGWWLQILADQFINVMYKVNKHSLKIVRLLK